MRLGEIEGGKLLAAEAERVCPPQHLVAEQLERDWRRRSEGVRKRGDELPALSASRANQKGEGFTVVQRVETRQDFRRRGVP